MSNKHLSLKSVYLYSDHMFGYENWSHELKNQTMSIFFCKMLMSYLLHRFNE